MNMDIDQNTCLVKYVEKSEYAACLVKGVLYCANVEYFASLEGDVSGRLDAGEGLLTYDPVHMTGSQVFVDNVDVSKGLLTFQSRRSYMNTFLYCMSAVPQHEIERNGIPSSKYGEIAVLFRNGAGFVEHVKSAVKNCPGVCRLVSLRRSGYVKYFDPSRFIRVLEPLDGSFYKHERYNKDAEYRFVFDALPWYRRVVTEPWQANFIQRRQVGTRVQLVVGNLEDMAEIVYVPSQREFHM